VAEQEMAAEAAAPEENAREVAMVVAGKSA
jgi:hypothetical protein